jgi:hypothetical protein
MNDPEYHKKYYEDHKEKHKEYYRQRIICPECNAEYGKSNETNHIKSKKHQKAITIKEATEYDKLLIKYNKLKYKLRLIKIVNKDAIEYLKKNKI